MNLICNCPYHWFHILTGCLLYTSHVSKHMESDTLEEVCEEKDIAGLPSTLGGWPYLMRYAWTNAHQNSSCITFLPERQAIHQTLQLDISRSHDSRTQCHFLFLMWIWYIETYLSNLSTTWNDYTLQWYVGVVPG